MAGSQVLPPGADGPASDCSGQVPIVVASDEAAQSDLYSAATLAGVLDTTCIVLAGARGEPMDAAQVARLDAADAEGWVMGGEAAVPAAKVAGRSLKRSNGVDRWHTARLTGAVAVDPGGDIAALTAATAPVEGEAAGSSVMVDGAEVRLPPNLDADCTGQTPIVVAADAAAQSDLYSAATLAGVLDTTCIVLAGARGAPMAAEQLARLATADGNGWVVGGEAAVPPAKLKGYNLTRQGGTDRWHTARIIGATAVTQAAERPATQATTTTRVEPRSNSGGGGASRSSGGGSSRRVSSGGSSNRTPVRVPSGTPAAGTTTTTTSTTVQLPPTTTTVPPTTSSSTTTTPPTTTTSSTTTTTTTTSTTMPSVDAQVAAGGQHSCWVRVNGPVVCWGADDAGQSSPPVLGQGDSFVQVSAGGSHSCGVTSGGSAVCWGSNDNALDEYVGQATPPAGSFTQVSAGGSYTCGVTADGAVVCWGYAGRDDDGRTSPPAGSFTQVSAGGSHTCGLKGDGTINCWGNDARGQATPPVAGSFTQVSAGETHTCAVTSGGSIACWGNDDSGRASLPASLQSERFTAVAAGGAHSCALKVGGSIACWGNNLFGQLAAPVLEQNERFTQLSAGFAHSCAVKRDGSTVCWGSAGATKSTPPDSVATAAGVAGLGGGTTTTTVPG